jgi:hypothetical protein
MYKSRFCVCNEYEIQLGSACIYLRKIDMQIESFDPSVLVTMMPTHCMFAMKSKHVCMHATPQLPPKYMCPAGSMYGKCVNVLS